MVIEVFTSIANRKIIALEALVSDPNNRTDCANLAGEIFMDHLYFNIFKIFNILVDLFFDIGEKGSHFFVYQSRDRLSH